MGFTKKTTQNNTQKATTDGQKNTQKQLLKLGPDMGKVKLNHLHQHKIQLHLLGLFRMMMVVVHDIVPTFTPTTPLVLSNERLPRSLILSKLLTVALRHKAFENGRHLLIIFSEI